MPSTYQPVDWKQRMEHALELFNDERFVPCMAECRALLSYEELSPYYQIHCRALIAGCLDDWYEAEEERIIAETLWTHSRRVWPASEENHELLTELRDVLDTLASDMEQDRPVEADQEDNALTPNSSTDNISIASASPVSPASATPPKDATVPGTPQSLQCKRKENKPNDNPVTPVGKTSDLPLRITSASEKSIQGSKGQKNQESQER